MNPDPNSKSLLHTIGHGSLVITIGNVILKIFIILSTVFVLRYLTVYDYGLWRLILGVIGFATIVTLPDIESVLIADMSRELGNKNLPMFKAMLIQSSKFFTWLGIAAFALLFFGAPLVSKYTGIDMTWWLRLLSFSFVANIIRRAQSIVFYSKLQFAHVQGMKIISKITYSLMVIYLLMYVGMGINGIVHAYLWSIVVSVVVYMPPFLKSIRELATVAADAGYSTWRMLKSYGKWTLLTSYFDDLFASLRPWIIGFFVGVETLAVVSVAFTMFGEIVSVLPLSQIFSPIIPREVDNKERFRLLLERGIKYSIWFYALVGIATFIFAPFFIGTLFPKYVSSIPYLNKILLTLLIMPLSVITSQVFYAMKAQKELFISTIVPRAVGNLAALPVFLFMLGPIGVILEFIFTSLLLAYMRLVSVRKLVPEIPLSLRSLVVLDSQDDQYFRRIIGNIKSRVLSRF